LDPIHREDLIRVVLTGSESVGKTMLAERLARHYGVEHVPEFVRDFAARKGAPIDFRDHGAIAHGQMALEGEYAARADRLLIQDTDLASTVIYCEHYFDHCPTFIIEAAGERRADLYLLLDIDVPWVPDGIRDRGDRREEMHDLFAQRLNELGMRTVEISGDHEARFSAAVRAIDALLDESTR
jgi:NadR type nicotinamide-nucleotide adenylyltransferase